MHFQWDALPYFAYTYSGNRSTYLLSTKIDTLTFQKFLNNRYTSNICKVSAQEIFTKSKMATILYPQAEWCLLGEMHRQQLESNGFYIVLIEF